MSMTKEMTKRYKETLKEMKNYTPATTDKNGYNIPALYNYAKSKGVQVAELNDEEKDKFFIKASNIFFLR